MSDEDEISPWDEYGVIEDEDLAEYRARFREKVVPKRTPRPKSLIARQTVPRRVEELDPATGEWRTRIKMSRDKFTEIEKGIFLEEFCKWGRMGESAAAAGVSTQTVRRAMQDDEDFAEAVLIAGDDYRDKLVGHHQDLIFNGVMKKTYDRNGNLVSEERQYPVPLLQMELRKVDPEYREKQDLNVNHTGGVLVAPAEVNSIEDWESRFTKAKDVSPVEDSDDPPHLPHHPPLFEE